nr:glycine-rich protein 23-like [Ipomoea batatas]
MAKLFITFFLLAVAVQAAREVPGGNENANGLKDQKNYYSYGGLGGMSGMGNGGLPYGGVMGGMGTGVAVQAAREVPGGNENANGLKDQKNYYSYGGLGGTSGMGNGGLPYGGVMGGMGTGGTIGATPFNGNVGGGMGIGNMGAGGNNLPAFGGGNNMPGGFGGITVHNQPTLGKVNGDMSLVFTFIRRSLNASNPASVQMALISAPENSSLVMTNSSKLTSSAKVILAVCRSRAGSRLSILLVARITFTSPRESKPSSWLSNSSMPFLISHELFFHQQIVFNSLELQEPEFALGQRSNSRKPSSRFRTLLLTLFPADAGRRRRRLELLLLLVVIFTISGKLPIQTAWSSLTHDSSSF